MERTLKCDVCESQHSLSLPTKLTRHRALDSLFSTLKTYGSSFPVDFWDSVCSEILFPIFSVLKSSQDLLQFNTQEDMSVWLSTTMIQALRDFIDLFTFFYVTLERFLDGLLDLLSVCICQGGRVDLQNVTERWLMDFTQKTTP